MPCHSILIAANQTIPSTYSIYFLSFFLFSFFISFLVSNSIYPRTVAIKVTVVLDHTQRHTYTHDRTPLKGGSACRGTLYLTTHNTHKRQISLPRRDPNPRPQTHALDCATTRIGTYFLLTVIPSHKPQTRKKKLT